MPIKLHKIVSSTHNGFLTFHPFAIHASLHSLTLTIVILAFLLVAITSLYLGATFTQRSVKRRLNDLSARLSDDDLYSGQPNRMETVLARLEHAATSATGTVTDSTDDISRLKCAMDSISQGIVITDEQGTPFYKNTRASMIMESRHAELIAAQAVEEMLEAGLSGVGSERSIELYGPPRQTLNIKTLTIEDHSKPLGVVAVIEDVSERKRLESVRRDFVANVSHELKTPIGAMALLAETLEDESDLNIAKRLANRLHHEALRVGRVIDDLINLSRIEAEENPPAEPINLCNVVTEAIEGLTSISEQRGVEVEFGGSTGTPIIIGDYRELLSAVTNLIENAIHYSDEDSTVRIRCDISDEKVELVVEDEGIGIPSRDLERIFERFYRVDQTRSRHNKGTGLGLSIVRHVINRHQGEIEVNSREGEGTTFRIILPRQGAQVISQPASPS